MIPDINDKQVAIKLNEQLIGSLDRLAKAGGTNRTTLMHMIVSTCLDALDKADMPGIFYIASLLRVRKLQLEMQFAYEHEFTGFPYPEKAIPMKFSEEALDKIGVFFNHNHITRHLLLKTIIIVGIEEMERLTDGEPYQLDKISKALFKSYSDLMKRGYKAFRTFIKDEIF